MQFYPAGERILLTLWVGGLWAIGYIVTPTLFNVLDDRQLAGMLAGELFAIISYLGLICGGLLLIGNISRSTGNRLRDGRTLVLIVMLLLIVVGHFVLQPMMAELKQNGLIEGSQQATRFGRIHGVASVLYLINSILGLSLVVLGLKR